MKDQFEKVEENAFKIKNLVEIDLANRYFETAKSDENLEKWVPLYSEKFGKLIGERPDILALFATDKNKAFEEVEKLLYGENYEGMKEAT
ncbi:MAG: hypothetical protein WCT19_02135 [Candidatus Paceibacterota bacterium]|jgi:Mg2+/Co2+ transporter CorC